MQPLSGNQRPELLTSLMNMSFVLRLPREMHLCRSSSNVPCLPSFFEMLQNPHVLLTFEEVHNPLRLPRETTSEPPKVVRTPSALNILTSKCASRHNGVHFFDISTAKGGPHLVCFVFCTCSLRNVLRATTACTFSTSQLPKVVRTWCALYMFTSKCASRHNGVHFFDVSTSKSVPRPKCFVHFDLQMCFAPQREIWKIARRCGAKHICNGVQFFISHLASWLRTHRFSEPTFRPSGAPNDWKKKGFATFLPFRASASSFFLLFLFYSSFFSSFSSLCLFPALLFICPYCRKFDF